MHFFRICLFTHKLTHVDLKFTVNSVGLQCAISYLGLYAHMLLHNVLILVLFFSRLEALILSDNNIAELPVSLLKLERLQTLWLVLFLLY